VPTAEGKLRLAGASYSNAATAQSLSELEPGASTNLGVLYLVPLDGNSNGLADSWERTYFGWPTNVVATNDMDGDGLSNEQEYLCGTDPTRSDSGLLFERIGPVGTSQLILEWPVAPGRSYQVRSSSDLYLPCDQWPWVDGPWTASASQSNMQWTHSAPGAFSNRYYRLQLLAPQAP
jgi:hypothetical protein